MAYGMQLSVETEELMKRYSTLNVFVAAIVGLTVSLGGTWARAVPCQDVSCALSQTQNNEIRATRPDQRIRSFVQKNNLPSFTQHGKMVFATNAQTDSGKYLGQLSPNLVEFFITPGFHHLYTRVGDKTYSRISGLGESSWYKSSSERIGVLVHLTDSEMGRLKTYVDQARTDPDRTIGKFIYGGGRPPSASNCTSWITWASIGDRGETLARILGVYESGMPQGFIGSLMRSSSDRVKAIVVHNPKENFGNSYSFDLH
jgi:hypothetical protein